MDDKNRKMLPKTPTKPNKIVKTSTPNKQPTNALNFSTLSNISIIHAVDGQQQPSSSKSNENATKKLNTCGNKGTASSTFKKPPATSKSDTNTTERKNVKTTMDDDEDIADYNTLLQGLLFNEIKIRSNARARDEIDESLAALQKRIADNQEILRRTKENIQKINKNQDIEYLIKLHQEDFKHVSDLLISKRNKDNKIEKSEAVAKELQKMRDKVACENIIVSESVPPSLSILNQTFQESLSAYKKLSEEPCKFLSESKEMCDLLENYENQQKNLDKLQESCSKIIPSLSSLVLEDVSNKICDI